MAAKPQKREREREKYRPTVTLYHGAFPIWFQIF